MDQYLKTALIRNIEKWSPVDGPSRKLFFQRLSSNNYLNSTTLIEYPNEHWDVQRLQKNKNFKFDWVDILPHLQWNWYQLSMMNPPISFILDHKDKPLDWVHVSLSNSITFDEMLAHPDLPWVVEEVFFNSIENEDEIRYLIKYKYRYNFHAWIDHSSRASWDCVKNNPELPWLYYHVIPDVQSQEDIDFIMNNNPEGWNWSELSLKVPVEFILKNKKLTWHWSNVSANKTLTWNHVIENPDVPWDYSCVPAETLDEILARKWLAASKIKRYFKRAISDPTYELCRNRLLREWIAYSVEQDNVAQRSSL